MAITDSDLQYFYPTTISDTSANGGRLSSNLITSNVDENVFPRVLSTERLAGGNKKRKVFCKVNSDNSDSLFNAGVYYKGITPAGDMCHFIAGTQRNTQGDLTGSEAKFGSGTLNTATGSTTLIVNVEDSTLASMFRNGLKIWISDGVTEEIRTINGVPTVVGAQVTMTVSVALSKTYPIGTVVSSIYEPSSPLKCNFDNWVKTSASGSYDQTTYPPIMNNRGTIEQTWTVAFTDATNFTVIGDTVGVVGSGVIGTNFAPNNPSFSRPYFTLETAGWGGTWATNDNIVFQTHPITIPVFESRDIPAGIDPYYANLLILHFYGEA